MGMLYEPDKPTDRFSLTPDYDRLMAEFAEAYPDPRFSTEECRPFGFPLAGAFCALETSLGPDRPRMTGHAGIAANPVESQ